MKIIILFLASLMTGAVTLSAQDSTGLTQTTHVSNILDNFHGLNSYFIASGFRPLENTVGTPYLYPDWGRMWIDSMDNKAVKRSVVYDANMDIEKNVLIIKGGDGKAYAPETNNIQAFHFMKNDTVAHFVNMKIGNIPRFVQRLAIGKYTLVKDARVLFSRANYEDKGMTHSGHNYDEYKKEYTYYLIKNGVPEKISLKRKSFLAAVGKDPEALVAANKFLEGYNGTFDELIATGFITALNQ